MRRSLDWMSVIALLTGWALSVGWEEKPPNYLAASLIRFVLAAGLGCVKWSTWAGKFAAIGGFLSMVLLWCWVEISNGLHSIWRNG